MTLTFERNESHPQGAAEHTITADWFQVTYNTITSAPGNGEEIAAWDGHYWRTPDGETWSDIVFG